MYNIEGQGRDSARERAQKSLCTVNRIHSKFNIFSLSVLVCGCVRVLKYGWVLRVCVCAYAFDVRASANVVFRLIAHQSTACVCRSTDLLAQQYTHTHTPNVLLRSASTLVCGRVCTRDVFGMSYY